MFFNFFGKKVKKKDKKAWYLLNVALSLQPQKEISSL